MDYKDTYPDYSAVEQHIKRAHLERSVAVGNFLADLVVKARNFVASFSEVMGRGLAAERDRRAIEADSFLKRSVPKY